MFFEVPKISKQSLSISIKNGDCLFLIGANGSGKSALIQHFVSSHSQDKIKRITAHRQTAFDSERPTFTYADRHQFDQQIRNWDIRSDARWKEDHQFGQQKQLAILFDFIASENAHARSVRDLVRVQNIEEAKRISDESSSPFGQINNLFQIAHLTASLILSNDGEILAHHNDLDSAFRIAHLSDGERSATIMAATVLIVEPDTGLLIDEPERHLHRSIVVPFLSALFEQRKDCSFVVSTHESALPIANPDAKVLVIHRCKWSGADAQAWDVDLLSDNKNLPEDLKLALLGARRRILFVEGEEHGLDRALYSALFPGTLVISKGNCGEVQKAVSGLRDAEDLHHAEAFGLIDEDGRSQDEIATLANSGVFTLNAYSVESLYYCSESITSVAQRQADSLGADPERLIEQSTNDALAKIDDDLARSMAARRSERTVRRYILSKAPNWRDLKAVGTTCTIDVSVESPYERELQHFAKLVDAKDLDGLVARYPLRHSGLFGAIARALRCNGRDDYHKIVVAHVRRDRKFAGRIKERIGAASRAIET